MGPQAIIGGEPAAELSGIVQVSHAHGELTCSGTLIAPGLVLTAMHCVVRSSADGDMLLPADGFRIGFGPSDEQLERRSAVAVAWVGMPDPVSVTAAVAAGDDVAILELDAPAPDGELAREVELAFAPADQQAVRVAGFGITDRQTGQNGVRTVGSGRITGYEPATGIVQVEGDSICFGDSGGPLLSADLAHVVGVLGQVGGSGDAGFCEVGLSFATTAANVRVRRLIAKECARAGGCGTRIAHDGGSAPVTARDSGGDDARDSAPAAEPTTDGAVEAGTRAHDGGTRRREAGPTETDPADESASSGCSVRPVRLDAGPWAVLCALAVSALARRRHKISTTRRSRHAELRS